MAMSWACSSDNCEAMLRDGTAREDGGGVLQPPSSNAQARAVPSQPLQHGVSVTDACISLAQTLPVLEGLAAAVRARRQKLAA